MTETINLKEYLSSRIVGQKRTGKHKAFVFIDYNKIGGPYATKGPFSSERASLVEKRAKILKEWSLPFIVKPLFQKKGEDLRGGNDGYYLVYENLLKGETLETTPYTESMTNYHGISYSYKVLERQNLVKLSDVLMDIDWLDTPFEGMTMAVWLMISMIGLFVLQVGDMHFSNVLVNLSFHTLYIIDYDDSNQSVASGEIFYFKMPPAKEKLEKWLSLVRPHYQKAIKFLTRFTSDPIYGERFQSAINCLQEEAQTQGKMKFRGMFCGSTTFSGCPIDEVKSQLQKSIRRNEPHLALLSAFELYRFSEVEGGKGIVTNLYNRLAIISAEDVGPANLGLMVTVLKLVKAEIRDPNVLGAMVESLCSSQKTRIGSHLWRVYMNEEGRKNAVEKGLEVNDVIRPNDQLVINDRISGTKDPQRLVAIAAVFRERLVEKSFSCMIWLAYFISESEGVKLPPRAIRPRLRRTEPIMLIWEILKDFLDASVWEILVDMYLLLSENRPFLMIGIVSALYRVEYKEVNIGSKALKWEKKGLSIPYLNGTHKLTIQPEAIDKHTKRGRQEGKTRETFVNDGAAVNLEDPDFAVPIFQEVYRM
jgi:hypothetical protein